MNRDSLFAWLRLLAAPSWRRLTLWALVLALSLLSFYVHLWRVSVFRGEAALAFEDAPMLASRALPSQQLRR